MSNSTMGGVAVGDVNGDDRTDLYLTAKMAPNALFLNEGNMRFREVTEVAGVAGKPGWTTGVVWIRPPPLSPGKTLRNLAFRRLRPTGQEGEPHPSSCRAFPHKTHRPYPTLCTGMTRQPNPQFRS